MKSLVLNVIIFISTLSIFGQTATLIPRAPFAGTLRFGAASFAIGNKGYVCSGFSSLTNDGMNDLWEYDAILDLWTQKANLPAIGRYDCVGFEINGKGYVSTGENLSQGIDFNDLWEYDPLLNSWIQKSNMPTAGRVAAVCFVISSKAYICTGLHWTPSPGYYFNDLWEYEPVTDSWQQKATFPGTPRAYATSFSIGTKGYVGLGANQGDFSDFYEYDVTLDNWIQKNNLPVPFNVGMNNTEGFSISNYGYIFGGFGLFPAGASLQQYDQMTDTWQIIYNSSTYPPYYTNHVAAPSIFVINNVPYITQGISGGNYYFPETMQINFSTSIYDFSNNISNQLFVSPNPSSTQFQISNFKFQPGDEVFLRDLIGKIIFTKKITAPCSQYSILTTQYSSGIYFLQIKTKEGMMSKKVVVQH